MGGRVSLRPIPRPGEDRNMRPEDLFSPAGVTASSSRAGGAGAAGVLGDRSPADGGGAPGGETGGLAPGLGDLARQVLATLQARAASAATRRADHPEAVTHLLTLALDAAPFSSVAAIDALLDRGIDRDDLLDLIVPATARRLGECWNDSALSFARVTVAAGRLQEMAGALVQRGDPSALRAGVSDRRTARAHGPRSVLVLSMAGDQHTLGWKVVTMQLRRRGIAAHAAPGVSETEGADLIAQAPYDLVLVSASRRLSVARAARMADIAGARVAPMPPVVVGGLVERPGVAEGGPTGPLHFATTLEQAFAACQPARMPAAGVAPWPGG